MARPIRRPLQSRFENLEQFRGSQQMRPDPICLTSEAVTRFWEKVRPQNDGCWIWTAKTRLGYGRYSFRSDQKKYSKQATHIALELDGYRRPSRDHHAIHECDNPACVNPLHLRWATHTDNMRDMCAKGRLNQSGLSAWRARGKNPSKRAPRKRGLPLGTHNTVT